MGEMKRVCLGLLAAAAIVCAVPAVASATEIAVGVTTTPVTAPSCGAASQTDCRIVLTKVTAFETLRDGVASPTLITQPGIIESLTVGVSGLSTDQSQVASDVSFLDQQYGNPEVQLTVLRPLGKPGQQAWQVASQSQAFSIKPFVGSNSGKGAVVQLWLVAGLPVVKGEVLALTVPTWAPVLSFGLNTAQFSYRQSRKTGCTTTLPATTSLAALSVGEFNYYGCNYAGTRIEYSATEGLTP
jgi:hypothetical protein